MHFIFRFFYILIKKRFLPKASCREKTIYEMRVLPTDLDILMHVNNGVYFSFMDFGRWDMIFRNGVYDYAKKMGWYSVVAAETIRFRRSLTLWNKFRIESQIMGADDKNFFIRQEFYLKKELMATGLVKIRFLKKSGGGVSPQEVMKAFGDTVPDVSLDLASDWAEMERKYLITKS